MTVTFLDRSEYKPLQLEPGDFRSFEACLKKFRKVVEKEGILKKVVERRRGFKKPSQKRREAKRRAIHNAKRQEQTKSRSRVIPITV